MIKYVFFHKNQLGMSMWCGKPWKIGKKLDFRAFYSLIQWKIELFIFKFRGLFNKLSRPSNTVMISGPQKLENFREHQEMYASVPPRIAAEPMNLRTDFVSCFSVIVIVTVIVRYAIFVLQPEIYIQSAPNNLNEFDTFMCLGREGRCEIQID